MRVFVQSFGCSTNLADGEVLAGCLAEAGYKIVESVSSADLVIYNTCAVKGPTENRVIELLKRVPADKKLVVAGCLPLINYERLRRETCFDGVVGPAAGKRIVEVVRRVFEGERVVALRDAIKAKPSLDLPRLQLNPIVSIIPINYGCLGSCTYCCVVFARGHLRSYSIEEISGRVRRDLEKDVKEFWVTSQDTACYGRDIGVNLAELLNALCSIKGDFRVRVGMMTPNIVTNILNDLVQAFKSEKIFKFLHLPLQSGNNQILKRMRRFYTADDFKNILSVFRKAFPEITIATDVICGFPGEDQKAFEETLQLIEEIKPDIVNVSKFFARPRTSAAKMKEEFVPLREIKRRSLAASNLARTIALERNKRWVGWSGEILIDEIGKVRDSWIGRNFAYKPIVVKCADNLLGRTLNVRVLKVFSTHLEGEIIK
ncbi:MAG: tRNA (N(6)-L-threonylcarbamoyladenosine(37)-C(2))-methylthiotransferase [Candidatus Bathycorpusculaceae bacterium]